MKENVSDQSNKKPDPETQELQAVFDIWSSVKGLARTKEPVPAQQYHYSYNNDEQRDQGGYSRLHDYLHSTRKHLWVILGIVIVITTLVAFYMARQPDVYDAQAHIQVDLEANNPVLGSIKSNAFILNATSQDPTYFNTQMQILSSAGLLSRVVKTLDLEHNQAFMNPADGRSTWEGVKHTVGFGSQNTANEQKEQAERLGADSLAPATAREDLAEVNRLSPFVENLQSRLTVKQINETRLIEIHFKHGDPQVAASVLNAIADAFVYANLERKTETSDKAGDFLQKRIVELQTEIRSSEERLNNYAKNHQIISLDANQNTVVDRLSGLNKQLLEAENERKLAEAAFRASQAPGAAEALADSQARQASEADTKLVELRQKRAELLVEYTEKVPQVREIDDQIATLEKQAEESRKRAAAIVTANLATNYRQALAREQALRTSFDQQRGETLTQNEAAVNYRIIQQEIETNKGLLDGLLQRAKENDVVVAGTPNNIHVVDYATVPKSPVGPKRVQAMTLAALIAFVFGIALARYLDYLDDTIHSSDDVEKMLRLPALAVIPTIGSSTRRRLLSTVTALQLKSGNGFHPELLLNTESRSVLSEAYRHLRTSILLSSAGGAPQSLLVTSSQPAEGKTTTAVNTALILQQTGADVLVIDADMRRPRLHSVFGLENRRGLSTILTSQMSDAEMLEVIEKHEASGVSVLTSGMVPPNPAELIGSEMMQRLMAALKRRFTYIVFDSPPVASFTDGVLISSLTDGVLLVVHGDHASRSIVRRSRQVLQDVGAKVFGVVLNNVKLRRDDYYYYKYYRSQYGKAAEDASLVAS